MNEKIIKIANQKLVQKGYAKSTVNSYMTYIKLFAYVIDKQYAHWSGKDFNEYLLNFPYTSRSQQDQVVSALKFLYQKVLNKKYLKVDFVRPRKEKPLPKVVDGNILLSKLHNVKNLKHRAILSLAYSTGMRASELLNIKISHCDKHRKRFRVVNSKGNKSRELPMTKEIQDLLRKYYFRYRPKEYLFNGQDDIQYSYSSLLKISKKHLDINPHIIRHTYASELLNKGVDIRIIQELLGHSSIKTTEIYTHVVNRNLDKLPSLLAA